MSRLTIPFRSLLALVATGASLVAQDTSSDPRVGRAARGTPPPALPASAWRVPIHTLAADPVGGEYGWWAGGQSFKVSFHDGFVFYPYLGPDDPENLPLRWTTESITVDGTPVADQNETPAHSHTDWRYEYRRAGVTEAYDVREDGVEQLFVIHGRPRQQGDLVVTGRIDTKLRPSSALPERGAHAALTFADARGRELVRYGEAFAVDAAGRRTEVRTTFAGGRVQLTVPGAWLEAAVYPVTVDPVTSRVTTSLGGQGFHTAIGRDGATATGSNLMFVVSRRFSSSDFDLYGYLCNDDFSNITPVFTDITAQWSSDSPGVAFVGAAHRWTVCLERWFFLLNPVIGRVRVFFHDEADPTLNRGTIAFEEPPSGTDWHPGIGGTARGSTGNNALLVFANDPAWIGGPNSVVLGLLADAATQTLGARRQISPAQVNFYDCDLPAVNQVSDGGTASWIVAFQLLDYLIQNDDYDILINRVTSTGVVAGFQFAGPDTGSPKHKLEPVVAGRGGRYLVAMHRSDSLGFMGNDVAVDRFDWPENAASPNTIARRIVATAPAPSQIGRLALSYDSLTRSHWALAYEQGTSELTASVFVRRLGFTGGTVEVDPLYTGPAAAYLPGVTFNEDLREFPILYNTSEANAPVYAQRLQYPATAGTVRYGTSCGNGIAGADRPFAGSEFFTVSLRSVPAGTPGVLYLTLGSAAISLNPVGMPGCVFNVDPNRLILTIPATVTGNAARIQIPLPDAPLVTGDVFGQWIYTQPGLNPANLGATLGLRMQVR